MKNIDYIGLGFQFLNLILILILAYGMYRIWKKIIQK
jgi:hypothetical protein